MSQTTNYLITGTNRGLGLGLTTALLSRSNTMVIAAVRDNTSTSTIRPLSSLPTATGSSLIIVKIDSADPSTATTAMNELTSKYSINHIDVVIANAGISNYYGPAATTPLEEFTEHYAVNVLGPVALFQAVLPLLKKSSSPKFVTLSTGAASMSYMADLPIEASAYGSSKASLNYVTLKIHYENPWLIAFPISPGWVQTEMGNKGAVASGLKEAPVVLGDSIDGMLNKIDNATREGTSGTFQSFDETKYGW